MCVCLSDNNYDTEQCTTVDWNYREGRKEGANVLVCGNGRRPTLNNNFQNFLTSCNSTSSGGTSTPASLYNVYTYLRPHKVVQDLVDPHATLYPV